METLTNTAHADESLQQKVVHLGPLIGNTPLYAFDMLHTHKQISIVAKAEWQQFGGSVKARPAYRIIKDAIAEGNLSQGRHLLDASSGNTGIAYAQIGASLGIPVTLFLPENASPERKRMLKAFNVNLRYTPAGGGTDEAQKAAAELHARRPDQYFYADQYSNESNWRAHYDTTAPEIWKQTEGKITHFITGLGTTGTFMGTGRKLREYHPDIQLISVEPELAMHGLEGWKHMETARVPPIYDRELADGHKTVATGRAYRTLKRTAREKGLLLSPSSAANLAAALRVAEEIEKGVIVTILPDDGSKYGEVLEELF